MLVNSYKSQLEQSGSYIEPIQPSITENAITLMEQMRDLNSRLAGIRGRLFGESEGSGKPQVANAPVPSLATSIGYIHEEIQRASDQASSILNRL